MGGDGIGYLRSWYLVKWTLIDWLDRLPLRTAPLVDWIDARLDESRERSGA
jgi:hypothetical protein